MKKHHKPHHVKKHHGNSKKGKIIDPAYDEHEVMEKPAGHRVKPHVTHTDDKVGKINNAGNTTNMGKMGINSIGMKHEAKEKKLLKELSSMHKKHHADHMRLHKKYGKK